MCGIAGKYWFDPERAVDRGVVERMCERLRHRGPDDGDVWVDGAVGLGHRRLSILDLSPRGRQPMANEDGSIRITFNGEIYNFRALRADLESRGHVFRSGSDTEVVLHLYEELGAGLLPRLRGMFAFALWDGRRRRLLLARDRLGKKPLFWRADAHGIAFASEAQGLLADPGVRPEPDLPAIHHYLTFGYVPSPWSGFRGVQKLAPAHYLIAEQGRVRVERWWDLHGQPKTGGSPDELGEELLEKLGEAVRLRLESDVPVGALLSGGLDSSLVTALMREAGVGRLRTFSIGFPERSYDELPYARRVAAHLGAEHEDLVVEPDAVAILPRLVRHYGEPYADSSALPSFYLCEMARRRVKVVLGGDGGDEAFCGYERYLATAVAGLFDGVPRGLRAALARRASRLMAGSTPKSAKHRVRRFVESLALEPRRRYASWVSVFDDAGKEALVERAFAEAAGPGSSVALLERAYERSDAATFVERTMHVDVQTYLPDDLLVKMDIASMAHGLEVRSPLLDHEVVEFAARLPLDLKLRRTVGKWILRRVLRDRLPEETLRRPKMGFGVPIDRWFRDGPLAEMARDLLLSSRATGRGWFRRTEVERLLDEHRRGTDSHHPRLWALLMLEMWMREMVEERVRVEAAA